MRTGITHSYLFYRHRIHTPFCSVCSSIEGLFYTLRCLYNSRSNDLEIRSCNLLKKKVKIF